MKKYKLCIINSCSIEKSYGGIAPFMKNLDPFLQEAYEVTYIVLPDSLYNIQFIPQRLIYGLYLLGKRGKLKEFDMILSHVPEGSFVISLGKLPFTHICHGNFNPMSQSRFWYGKYFKSLFASMEKRYLKKSILKYTVGNERPGIPKIINPIHHQVQLKSNESRCGFIFSGRLEKIKKIDKIIKVYSQLPIRTQEENPLFIAGMGSQDGYLKGLANTLPIKGKVVFLGNLHNDLLVETDSSKKILLMASSQEGFPMAIAEALSLGVPVIATDTGDISRFLKSNDNGFLLPIDFKEEEYIEAIETILADYERFSKNALDSSVVFKAERIAKALIDDMNEKIAQNEGTRHPQ